MKICKIEHCTQKATSKGFCNNHYWQDRQKIYTARSKPKLYKSKVKAKRNKLTGETQGQFLFKVLENCTNNCQCCNDPIIYKSITNCAHILEKSRESFFIVSNNVKNIVYLCENCHHGFDNIGSTWFQKQNNKFKELIYDRVNYLRNFLTEAQQTHIKEYLNK